MLFSKKNKFSEKIFSIKNGGPGFALGAFAVLGIFICALYASAAWTNPTATPPQNNVPEPINAGVSKQTKLGNFNVGTTTSAANFFVYNGNIGIATTTAGTGITSDKGIGINAAFIADGRIRGLSYVPNFLDEAASRYYVDSAVLSANYWTASGNDIYNNNTGNVGIGIASPQTKLDIGSVLQIRNNGTETSFYSSSFPRLYDSATGGAYPFTLNGNLVIQPRTDAVRDIVFATYNGSAVDSRVVVQSTGNVGIGTTNPSYKLHVKGLATAIAGERLAWIGGAGAWDVNDYEELGIGYAGIRGIYTGSNQWGLAFSAGTSASFNAGTQGEVMRIDGAGNVGIGTTAMSYPLVVYKNSTTVAAEIVAKQGDATGSGASYSSLRLLNDDSGAGFFFRYSPNYTGSAVYKGNFTLRNIGDGTIGGAINFETGVSAAASRMFIGNDGNIGIGTTVPGSALDVYSGVPELRLRDSGSSAGDGGALTFWANAGTDELARVKSYLYDSTAGAEKGYLIFSTMRSGTMTEAARILDNGNVGIGMTGPGAKLEVAGQVKITGGTPGAGRVLTSDANGLASWTTPASGVGGSGTLNYVAKFTPDGNTMGNSQIFDNGTNVGIGSAVPGVKLDVAGNIRVQQFGSDGTNIENVSGTYTATKMVYAFNEGRGIGYNSADDRIYFAMNEGVPMVIDNDGNVGIGTTNPAAKLQVSEPTNAKVSISVLARGGNSLKSEIYFGVKDSGGVNVGGTIGSDGVAGGGLALRGDTGGIGTPHIYINSSGNVGIGTTVPGTKLHVYDSASGPIVSLSGLDTNYRGVAIKDAANSEKWFSGNNGSDNFVVRRNNSTDDITVLQSNGNVGIGTTAPGEVLDIDGNLMLRGALKSALLTTGAGGGYVEGGGVNLLPTGKSSSFEFDYSGWYPRSGVSLSRSTNVRHTGGYSLRADDTTTDSQFEFGIDFTDFMNSGETDFVASAWVYLPTAGGTSNIHLQYRDGGSNFYTGGTVYNSPNISVKDSWQRIVLPFKVNATTGSGYLWFWVGGPNDAGDYVYVDDIQIERGTIATAYNSNHLDFGDGDVYKIESNLYVSGQITAGSGDLAEEFYTDKDYPAGTVLVMDDNGYKSARACAKRYDPAVIGVISENPGMVIGKIEGRYKAPVALTGVIKVRVNNSGGQIHQGDLLTASAVSGEAMRAAFPQLGTIIGKALEGDAGKGYIMAIVNLK
jgi:hypothetical protein